MESLCDEGLPFFCSPAYFENSFLHFLCKISRHQKTTYYCRLYWIRSDIFCGFLAVSGEYYFGCNLVLPLCFKSLCNSVSSLCNSVKVLIFFVTQRYTEASQRATERNSYKVRVSVSQIVQQVINQTALETLRYSEPEQLRLKICLIFSFY